jgi:hypothetical protein
VNPFSVDLFHKLARWILILSLDLLSSEKKIAVTPKYSLKSNRINHARVAELADALDLGSSGETCGGSNPPPRTTLKSSSYEIPTHL